MQGGLEGGLERGGGWAEGAGGEAGGGAGRGAGELEAWVMLERELEGGAENCWKGTGGGGEIGKKSWKGGTFFLDGDRNLERALEGGEEFSTTQPETGRGLEGGFARFVAKMLEGDWKGTSPSRSQSNFFRAV